MISKPKEFTVDPKFEDYFKGRIKQVFLYITDNCNLTCTQCLYKPWLRRNGEIPEYIALLLLEKLKELGAIKLSLIGGEPTLYGASNGHKPLLAVIKGAKDLGYEYIRLDTNGQFSPELLKKVEFKMLDEITFSIDSHLDAVNDALRGEASFSTALENIRKAVNLGYKVDVTCCVHRENVGRNQDGEFLIESIIRFAEKIGVKRINFHPLFRMDIPRDEWAGGTDISLELWLKLYEEIRKRIDTGKYRIQVRIPRRFVTRKEFKESQEYYGYCPVKFGERVLVHSNGLIQICALRIGTPWAVARFDAQGIFWKYERNELEGFDFQKPTPCTNQKRNFGEVIPLCISFKPKQNEIIWQKLGWERLRK